MRASRLLTILMILQTRGRTSADRLAEELEVSVRTVYRDIDQLSAAGVPVYAETGRNGGFALLDGWKTRLNGLTAPEARALFFSGLPGPAGELGLGDEAAQAELKLLAALPADWQAEARRMSSRFHLDPRGWFQPGYKPEFLKLVAEAVWSETRIAIRYESWTDTRDRVIEPLGLVLKGGIWYVVAQREGNIRTYRLSQIQALGPTGETFTRPKDFDLPSHWVEATRQFERDIYVGTARVRASERGRRKLRDLSDTVRQAIEALTVTPDADGWAEFDVPIEEIGWASHELTRIGGDVEVLGPPELRARVVQNVLTMARLYRVNGT
ncbi:MAG: YafY family transcriptional regulator [Devosia sp.]|uniref:helix-turn-helix transcriptional regulator n=1 Tax=Devosia sp. TaxID=1871048 RepID=UPI001AC469D1|nr:YafY family protein [Devosia sp.]MBN9317557.1 YafY family transcriptional regulator [Devosia sp.]